MTGRLHVLLIVLIVSVAALVVVRWEWVDNNSAGIMALLTLALVVVTSVYAWLTRAMAAQMEKSYGLTEKSYRYNVLPIVVGSRGNDFDGPPAAGRSWELVIRNCGQGVALDVVATLRLPRKVIHNPPAGEREGLAQPETRQVVIPALEPGGCKPIPLPSKLYENNPHVEVVCRDILDRRVVTRNIVGTAEDFLLEVDGRVVVSEEQRRLAAQRAAAQHSPGRDNADTQG